MLSKLFKGKKKKKIDVKISAIGQSIVQASRPRAVLCPLQIGLAVQMHHHFQSKYLIDILLVFLLLIRRFFERNAAIVCGAELEGFLDYNSNVKLSADNVDHNLCTLDGQNTFHGMGMIASISNGKFHTTPIPRKIVTDRELLKASLIDLLWQMSWYFKNPQPIWSGYMQLIHEKQNNDEYLKDNIIFLPIIIDLDPTNLSCIYSTLLFLSNLLFQNNQPTVIAFDQPLFWKGNRIIAESNIETEKNCVT